MKIMGNEVLKQINIQTFDISGEKERHSFVARGTEQDWEGHPHTLLMPNGHTIFCAWAARHNSSGKHGAPGGNLKRSDDGGITWSEMLNTPENWNEIGRGGPTLHRLTDSNGKSRLLIFQRTENRETFLQAISEDEGKSWSPMKPVQSDKTIFGWTAPISILPVDGGKKHLMWYERKPEIMEDEFPRISNNDEQGEIWQSASYDGGLTWHESKPVVAKELACEPCVIPSPDGKQLLLLIRNGVGHRQGLANSFYSVSNDEGATWSSAKELPGALTGDRHLGRYSTDGRLVIVFRDMFRDGGGQFSVKDTYTNKLSHYIAWVGRYEDIVKGREGQYRIKLLHSNEGWNHGYSGLEVLSDGRFVATTYIKYEPGPNMHSVVSVHFKIEI